MDNPYSRLTCELQNISLTVKERQATLVYDYTYGGGAYVSQTTSNHVRLTKKKVPKPNWVSVNEAQKVGLVPQVIESPRNDTPRRTQ